MPMNRRPMSDFDKKVDAFFRNYQDRGMKKWAGFFPSDHTAKINHAKAKRSIVYPKRSEMTQEEISMILFKAFSNHYQVRIQLKRLNENGNLSADIIGFVEGYNGESTIVISGTWIDLDEINHVDII